MSDDEYYEDETPRRSLKAAAKAPARRSLRGSAPRSEEAEEAPRPRPQASSGGQLKVGRGWGASRRAIESTSSYAQNLKLTKDDQIIKFLEDEPYAAYARHWLERIIDGRKQNRAYLCLESVGAPCPICDVLGDRPQAVTAFNVALVDPDGTVSLKSWDVGVKVLRQIENHHTEAKTAPLTKCFYAVKKTGSGLTSNTNLVPILRSSFLFEDYGVREPEPGALEALGLYDESIIEIPKRSQLEEIAAELSDSGDYA